MDSDMDYYAKHDIPPTGCGAEWRQLGLAVDCEDGCPACTEPDDGVANAHLIAAAPELLAACEAALPLLVWLGDYIGNGGVHKHNQGAGFLDRCAAIGAVKDAIARARGES